MRFFWVSIFSCLLLISCGSDEDAFKPNPLVELDNQFSLKTLWSTSIGGDTKDKSIKLSPVYADNKIFVCDHSGHVSAVDPENGKIVWQVDLKVNIGGGPAVANNKLVVGTQKGEVILLNADDGSLIWKSKAPSEIIASPAIGEGHVVVNSVDGKITAFDLETGKEKWFYDQNLPKLTLRGTSSPIIAGGGVFSGFSNGKLAVFILESGRLAWEKTVAVPIGRTEIQKLVDVDVRPLLTGKSLYVGAYNGNLMHIDVASGEVLWQRELSTFQEISLSDLLLLVTHENSHVSAVDRVNGIILWTQKELYNRLLSPPVLFDNNIVIADFEGYLHWLSKKDGTMLSRHHIHSSGISAMPLVIDDKLILQSHSGRLYAVKKK